MLFKYLMPKSREEVFYSFHRAFFEVAVTYANVGKCLEDHLFVVGERTCLAVDRLYGVYEAQSAVFTQNVTASVVTHAVKIGAD